MMIAWMYSLIRPYRILIFKFSIHLSLFIWNISVQKVIRNNHSLTIYLIINVIKYFNKNISKHYLLSGSTVNKVKAK